VGQLPPSPGHDTTDYDRPEASLAVEVAIAALAA